MFSNLNIPLNFFGLGFFKSSNAPANQENNPDPKGLMTPAFIDNTEGTDDEDDDDEDHH